MVKPLLGKSGEDVMFFSSPVSSGSNSTILSPV